MAGLADKWYLLRKYAELPLPLLASRFLRVLGGNRMDRAAESLPAPDELIQLPLAGINYLNPSELDHSGLDHSTCNELARLLLDHRFDFLGTGRIRFGYDQESAGILGNHFSNTVAGSAVEIARQLLPEDSHQISLELIGQMDEGYRPIDWSRDMRSGFRFPVDKTGWAVIWPGLEAEGADIKIPQEIGRMQHLLQLASWAGILPERRNAIIREFRNQLIDFTAFNPVGYGPSWAIAMEPGIRIANVLMAFDLLSQNDPENILDEDFRKLLSRTTAEHGWYLCQHLEYNPGMTNNHYLGNIAGLLFAGAYLQSSETTDGWLAFAMQELVKEGLFQFYPDGGNFEASTYYHRFGLEIMLVCQALAGGLPQEKRDVLMSYQPAYWPWEPALVDRMDHPWKMRHKQLEERLGQAALLSSRCMKPNGEMPQIGDNDSGRFIRLSPVGSWLSDETYRSIYPLMESAAERNWDENELEVRPSLALAAVQYENPLLAEMKGLFPLEYSLLRSLSERISEKSAYQPSKPAYARSGGKLKYSQEQRFAIQPGAAEGMELLIHPDFQLHVLKSPGLYISVNAHTNRKQRFSWGHHHNDLLSVDIWHAGEDICRDPGTFNYTASFEWRAHFRRTAVHNVPVVEGEEQNRWFKGWRWYFSMLAESRVRLLEADDRQIRLELRFRGIRQERHILVESDAVVISDSCNCPFRQHFNKNELHSAGYGKLTGGSGLL